MAENSASRRRPEPRARRYARVAIASADGFARDAALALASTRPVSRLTPGIAILPSHPRPLLPSVPPPGKKTTRRFVPRDALAPLARLSPPAHDGSATSRVSRPGVARRARALILAPARIPPPAFPSATGDVAVSAEVQDARLRDEEPRPLRPAPRGTRAIPHARLPTAPLVRVPRADARATPRRLVARVVPPRRLSPMKKNRAFFITFPFFARRSISSSSPPPVLAHSREPRRSSAPPRASPPRARSRQAPPAPRTRPPRARWRSTSATPPPTPPAPRAKKPPRDKRPRRRKTRRPSSRVQVSPPPRPSPRSAAPPPRDRAR